MNPIDRIGAIALIWYERTVTFLFFVVELMRAAIHSRFHFNQWLYQIERHGIGSIGIIVLTGTFTGLALALQSYSGFRRIGAETFVGAVVTTTLIRELGPVLAALMITARSASGIAAELGTMRTTEQIDALRTLTINPYTYLVIPRVAALIFSMPLLTLLSSLCGIMASHFLITSYFGVSSEIYRQLIMQNISWIDIAGGLIKSCVFGFVIALTSTFNGFMATGGARGVGSATKQTVVTCSVAILALNYILGLIIFEVTPK